MILSKICGWLYWSGLDHLSFPTSFIEPGRWNKLTHQVWVTCQLSWRSIGSLLEQSDLSMGEETFYKGKFGQAKTIVFYYNLPGGLISTHSSSLAYNVIKYSYTQLCSSAMYTPELPPFPVSMSVIVSSSMFSAMCIWWLIYMSTWWCWDMPR